MQNPSTLKLTVIIRDEAPVRWLNEPVALRSVTIELTPEQQAQLAFRSDDEAISHAFLEAKAEKGTP